LVGAAEVVELVLLPALVAPDLVLSAALEAADLVLLPPALEAVDLPLLDPAAELTDWVPADPAAEVAELTGPANAEEGAIAHASTRVVSATATRHHLCLDRPH
jgi:hypothetical protein